MTLNEALRLLLDQDTAAKRLEFAKSGLWGGVVDAMVNTVLAARKAEADKNTTTIELRPKLRSCEEALAVVTAGRDVALAEIALLKQRIDELEARELTAERGGE